MKLYPLQETVLISISAIVLFGTAVSLATFIDDYRRHCRYDNRIKIPTQATAVSYNSKSGTCIE